MKISLVLIPSGFDNHVTSVINSLVNQTRRINEVVIVEEKSSNSTIALIEEELEHIALHIIPYINNDLLKSVEKGIKRATGDIIFISNLSDSWYPNKVDRFFEEFNKEFDFVFSDARAVNSEDEDLHKSLFDVINISTKERINLIEYKSDKVFSSKKCIINSTCAFRKSAIQKVFYPLLSLNEEKLIGSFFADMFSAYDSSKVQFIPEVLSSYNEEEIQILNQANSATIVDSKQLFFESKMKKQELILERVDNPHYRRSHYFWYMRSLAQSLPFLRKLITLNTLFLEGDYKRHCRRPFKEFVSDFFN